MRSWNHFSVDVLSLDGALQAVLYINKLRVAGVLQKGINSFFETIFETARSLTCADL